jgi:hypothetical protein
VLKRAFRYVSSHVLTKIQARTVKKYFFQNLPQISQRAERIIFATKIVGTYSSVFLLIIEKIYFLRFLWFADRTLDFGGTKSIKVSLPAQACTSCRKFKYEQIKINY